MPITVQPVSLNTELQVVPSSHNINRKSTSEQIAERRTIPKALKEQVWIKYNGEKYKHKCYISWCQNIITVFNFECGHNIPFSKGGTTTIQNLRPICSSCNKSMSNNYTIDEWITFNGKDKKWLCCF